VGGLGALGGWPARMGGGLGAEAAAGSPSPWGEGRGEGGTGTFTVSGNCFLLRAVRWAADEAVRAPVAAVRRWRGAPACSPLWASVVERANGCAFGLPQSGKWELTADRVEYPDGFETDKTETQPIAESKDKMR
jgi:hypothetical protein